MESTDDELTELNENIKSAIASKCDCPDITGDKNHCHEIRSSDVSNAIVKMKSDKISDNGLVYSNNFIFGTNLLHKCLSILFTSMIHHGFAPQAFICANIIPIPKSAKGALTCSDKYRSIAISSVIVKILDHIIIDRQSEFLKTSDYQCGFKPKSSTILCSTMVNETIQYYTENGRKRVYVLLLDATKAFDKVSFKVLFDLLLDKNVCPKIVQLLYFMYTNQLCHVKWGGEKSASFPISNGVKQGGVMLCMDYNSIVYFPRSTTFCVQEDLNQAYDVGIAKGIWKPVTFNEYGTPVVPVRKQSQPNQPSGAVRVCGDYSVFINGQLETHRQPMPLPEDLMRRLDGTHYFSKVDLADAYNQIELGPESQRRLALSTHRGVLLQTRLPFGISSATGYFQDVMNQLTSDLPGVAVYLDDILISGKTAEDHLNNLRRLLKRLNDRGLRCRIQKCVFAQNSVTYLGHTISRDGISKGPKADAVTKMPAPSNISQLCSFLGSVQFYNKFLPDLSTISEPLYHLTEKHTKWKWEEPQQDAFQKLKQMLTNNTVLAHFDPSCPIGISCDASESGVGAVLFHRYKDNSERPIANASKTLTDAQKRYPQIQKEALSIIFALKKYHQFLYGRPFILVTDHKPLISMFGPNTATPMLAANRLARWSLMLSQYDYTIEYRSTKQHGNADALSRLPVGPDLSFDGEEGDNDVDTVCTIRVINSQLQPHSRNQLKDATNKDPVLSEVKRYVREGWPQKIDTPDVQAFKKYAASLSVTDDCLINGNRVVIPEAMQPQTLDILHLGHFGMQRMKQLARSAVYWPHIDSQIEDTCRGCVSCAEHQNKPPKPANHPRMMPEKPWSRIHVDHAINFMGNNWLIVTDAYSKYPCIHQTSSTSTQATTALLEEDFAHFGYPHTIVSDNATTFSSAEFQLWCHQRGIKHLTGAPYHPATNGAAERMVQSFKQSLKKSKLPPRPALQEFLMQYRRTPLNTGFSPSQLLNGRQLRTKIDALLPSPAHIAQEHQAREATKSQQKEQTAVQHVRTAYDVGTPCYALYCGPRQTSTPRWVPATITRVHGTRTFTVKVHPRGPLWKRHLEQLRPRYGVVEDADPGIVIGEQSTSADKIPDPKAETLSPPTEAKTSDHTLPEYGRHNPRRSSRQRKTRQLYNAQ